MTRNALHAWSFCLAALAASAAPAAAPRPTVVELYTSEGCSSCPPAEAYLGELAQNPDVLALAFHVDYWDGLGWRDPFALPAFTARQDNYARALGLGSVFTPQVVVDGRESWVGSDRGRIGKRLTNASTATALALTEEGGELVISVAAERSGIDIVLVPYRRRVVSEVERGENRGRTLEEFDVARDLKVLGHARPEPSQWRVRLDTLPADTTDVAVLAQQTGQGIIVDAARLALTR